MHPWFETFILLCVVGNMIVLAMVYYDMPDDYGNALDVVNTIFVAVFAAEMVTHYSFHLHLL